MDRAYFVLSECAYCVCIVNSAASTEVRRGALKNVEKQVPEKSPVPVFYMLTFKNFGYRIQVDSP